MSAINGTELNLKICDALGIDTENLASIKLEVGGKTPTITLVYYIVAGANEGLAQVFENYTVVKKEE